ncbi:WS/DGAT/MGAT family O-acyltransferase [Antrihabitans cavernicola]|uniref:WS/DGAT/MGAT family O-acyltransferase n=1 Tax=Antrihabitans cavernicola TaxID=2495913 RepID=UPI001F184FF3|nr:wax ester/triacylglycerol synthase family O-acyltransferase [Spelaeibacter cavernicola]
MHVGAVLVFTPPKGADATYLRSMLENAVTRNSVARPLRKRARRSLTSLGQWGWDTELEVDLDYHIHRHALPAPGGTGELFDLVSRLHGDPLDCSRPLWEMALIEGLDDGRFAVYVKIHHALTDGVAAMRMLRRRLSSNPDEQNMPALWEQPAAIPAPAGEGSAGFTPFQVSGAAWHTTRSGVGEVVGLVPALADSVHRALHRRGGPLSLSAPASVLNVPVTRGRRFAARSWPLERLRLVAKHADTTVNDVVLTMCAGALRAHLLARHALPEAPLIAMVPVALPDEQPRGQGGNRVGVFMCNLGTRLADPICRLAAIRVSTAEGKAALSGMSPLQTLAAGALGIAPLAAGLLGLPCPVRPPNVIISNVAGSDTPLYWNGARLDALYPVSVPFDGQALNITCSSTGAGISFGLTAAWRAVPALQPFLDDLDGELAALETACGL